MMLLIYIYIYELYRGKLACYLNSLELFSQRRFLSESLLYSS
uniref:Uncharacterized protein n=1 Tax=Heterorhabditis bacteriophora TaxID=37862 RepID=A0A1I7WBE6_HETBA